MNIQTSYRFDPESEKRQKQTLAVYEETMIDLEEAKRVLRRRYMEGQITHHTYYLWLAQKLKLHPMDLPSGWERLDALALHKWDAKHIMILNKAIAAGFKSWSLCESVCAMKAVAKELGGK